LQTVWRNEKYIDWYIKKLSIDVYV
jgi:hypothetical protein